MSMAENAMVLDILKLELQRQKFVFQLRRQSGKMPSIDGTEKAHS